MATSNDTTRQPLLSTRLSVDYPDKQEVVRNIELTVGQGEIVGLIGPSGCGKSTIALAALGLLELRGGIARGEAWFEGIDLLSLSDAAMRAYRGRRIALVLQSPMTALNPALTIGQQMSEAWRAHRKDNWEEPVCEALRLAALPNSSDFLTMYPSQLSVGQAQRVLIAMAILHRPSLVIADEPTSALDLVTQGEILALFRTLNQQLGTAFLMISHDLAAVASTCHRIAILHEGTIVESGTRAQIFGSPQHSFTKELVSALGEQESLANLLVQTEPPQQQAQPASQDRRSGGDRRSEARAKPPEQLLESDPLTGLHNTRALFLALDRELARLRRAGTSLTMIITDIQEFAHINERFGRDWGDQVLQAIARKLRDQSREYDILARTDEDEFVLVLPEFPVRFLEGRIQRLEQGAAAAGAEVVGEDILKFTTAWAICPDDGNDAESLLMTASQRLYDARKAKTAEVGTQAE